MQFLTCWSQNDTHLIKFTAGLDCKDNWVKSRYKIAWNTIIISRLEIIFHFVYAVALCTDTLMKLANYCAAFKLKFLLLHLHFDAIRLAYCRMQLYSFSWLSGLTELLCVPMTGLRYVRQFDFEHAHELSSANLSVVRFDLLSCCCHWSTGIFILCVQ